MNTHFRIAITGGIGSGKSYVCSKLAERGIKVYDCDAAAKRIMTNDHTLQAKREKSQLRVDSLIKR